MPDPCTHSRVRRLMSPTVELIFDRRARIVEAAREQLRLALTQAGHRAVWVEWDRSAPGAPTYARCYASPSVLVAGRDVAGEARLDAGPGCRIYRDAGGVAHSAQYGDDSHRVGCGSRERVEMEQARHVDPAVRRGSAGIPGQNEETLGWRAALQPERSRPLRATTFCRALCCIGPVTVLLLGAGGAVAAAGLTPYRGPLLVLSGVLVVAGYWGAYRSKVGAVACSLRVGRWIRASLTIAGRQHGPSASCWLVNR